MRRIRVNERIWIIRTEDGILGSNFYTSEDEAEREMKKNVMHGYWYMWVDYFTKFNPEEDKK
jgi:hypothetical protein